MPMALLVRKKFQLFLQQLGALHVRRDDGQRSFQLRGSACEHQRQTVAGRSGPGDDAALIGQHRFKQADRGGRLVLWCRSVH